MTLDGWVDLGGDRHEYGDSSAICKASLILGDEPLINPAKPWRLYVGDPPTWDDDYATLDEAKQAHRDWMNER